MKLWAILTTMFVLMIASINAGGVELQDADSLRIVSKTARYHTGKNYVDFHGDVHADNGEAKLTCENMKVYFDEQDQVKKNYLLWKCYHPQRAIDILFGSCKLFREGF
ncbi:MAG: LPS export ABC transporter periplasmic protein LptC [Lentisphaerales bacterium]|nr:LPS export ABC transporter periplasmic protein LptC [Lentisphaerales bacterium]